MVLERSFIRRHERALTRIEVLAIIIIVGSVGVILAACLTLYRNKFVSPAKARQCMGNLGLLGKAFAMYEAENDGRLPYGYIRYDNVNQTTWDTLLISQLRRNLRPRGESSPPPTFAERVRVLQCPDDTIEKAAWAKSPEYQRRSYSMPEHDMKPDNWPPGSRNSTGVGLWWSFGTNGESPPDAQIYNFEETNRQPAIRITDILLPSGVMLLGEQINSNNLVAVAGRATIATTFSHLDTNRIAPESFQGGLFNYLMNDGHVQAMSAEDSVGPAGHVGRDRKTHHGIWTIIPGD